MCKQDFIYQDDKCKICYAKNIWLTNTSIDNLGIYLWFKRFIPKAFKNFKYGFPKIHREILFEVIQDNPKWKVYDRQVVVAAPRGISKTTLLSKGFALYCAVNKLKNYIVLASKTSRAAQKNLRWIRSQLSKSDIIAIYGDLRPDAYNRSREQNKTETTYQTSIIILKNGVTIECVGMGQQLRSSAEGDDVNRVDLFIADDTEANENTGSSSAREGNKEWFFETAWPTLDIDTGTIIFINTETSNESVLRTLLNAQGWRKKFYQLSTINELGEEVSIWPEKFPLDVIEKMRQAYIDAGRLASFYKEYYNLIRSNAGFNDRWIRRYIGKIIHNGGSNWFELTQTDYHHPSRPEIYPAFLTLGIDNAFSQKESADFSVLYPSARIPDGRRFRLPYSRGRFSTFDDIDQSGKLIRKGIISEAVRLNNEYQFDRIIIDTRGTQTGIFQQLKKAIYEQCTHKPMLIPYNATGDKVERLKDYLFPLYESGVIHHTYGMTEHQSELLSIGEGHDDILDAEYNADKYSKDPDNILYDPQFGDASRRELIPHHQRKQLNWITA